MPHIIRLLQTTLDQPHHQLPLQGPLRQDLVHQVVAVVEVAQHIAIGQDTHPVTVLAMLMEKTIQGLAVPVVIVRITVRGMRLEQEAQPPVITPQRPC